MKVLAIALQKDNELASASFEMIQAAKSISENISTAILAENVDSIASELASRGGGQVLAVSDESLKFFNEEIYAKVLTELIKKHKPDVIICPASLYGKALLCRLAALNGGAMASEATGLEKVGETLKVTRPHFGGSVVSTIENRGDSPFFVTIRAKIFPESKDGSGKVINESIDSAVFEAVSKVVESKVEAAGELRLTEADRIVSAGRGMKGPEHIPMIEELAKSLGAAMGASRAIVDAGWISYSHQVGQTGKTVNPKLYIAVGISGAIQHLVGMRTSQTIVAINKDKDAPIFSVANYGIVGDAFEIVPALTAKFNKELGG